jgi:TonB family protein
MQSCFILVVAICLACTLPFLSQSTESSSKLREKDNRVIDLLSDTRGFDLTAYLNRIIGEVRTNWYHLIPESEERKKGRVDVRFRVMRDGHITNLKFDTNSGDQTLDRAAYDAIVASSPLRPLPSEFACEFIDLRFRFHYNPDPGTVAEKDANDQIVPCVTSKIQFVRTLGVTVSPSSAQVAVGSQQQFHATIVGAEDSTVTWRVGCEGSTCGTISADGLYTAPAKIPTPATISVTATLKKAPTESASSTITIVRAGDSP